MLPEALAGRGATQQGVGEGAVVTSGREDNIMRAASPRLPVRQEPHFSYPSRSSQQLSAEGAIYPHLKSVAEGQPLR